MSSVFSQRLNNKAICFRFVSGIRTKSIVPFYIYIYCRARYRSTFNDHSKKFGDCIRVNATRYVDLGLFCLQRRFFFGTLLFLYNVVQTKIDHESSHTVYNK